MKLKKIFVMVILALTVLGTSANASYSEWAETDIQKARSGGILTASQLNGDLTQPISRNDIAMLAVKAYINVMGYEMSSMQSHFTDTKSPYAEAAYRLGIIYGTSDTEFTPYANTTRQEMAKIILSLKAVINGEKLLLPNNPKADFTDFAALSDWQNLMLQRRHMRDL